MGSAASTPAHHTTKMSAATTTRSRRICGATRRGGGHHMHLHRVGVPPGHAGTRAHRCQMSATTDVVRASCSTIFPGADVSSFKKHHTGGIGWSVREGRRRKTMSRYHQFHARTSLKRIFMLLCPSSTCMLEGGFLQAGSGLRRF